MRFLGYPVCKFFPATEFKDATVLEECLHVGVGKYLNVRAKRGVSWAGPTGDGALEA